MLGAVAGDIIGSLYEFVKLKKYDFELLPQGSRFTDDSVMTIAVAYWLAHYDEYDEIGHTKERLIECMQEICRKYPDAGYAVHSTIGYGARIRSLTIAGAMERQCVSVRLGCLPRLLMKHCL